MRPKKKITRNKSKKGRKKGIKNYAIYKFHFLIKRAKEGKGKISKWDTKYEEYNTSK